MQKTKLMLLTVVVSLLAAAPADAKKFDVRVGIGDQNAAMFSHPDFQRLKIKRVRYFIPWHATSQPHEMQRATEFVNAAKAARVVRLHAHLVGQPRPQEGEAAVEAQEYKRDVQPLVKHFRAMGVREWGSRNEANHDSQATWKSPARAAWEFKIVARACKGCTVVGLDVLDQRGVASYIARFYRALGGKWRRRARIVGIHNYSDVNRKRMSGTRTIMRAARRYNPRAKFWLTETGGVVALGTSWPYSQQRAAKRLGYLFRVTKRYRRQIKRLYIYNWTGAARVPLRRRPRRARTAAAAPATASSRRTSSASSGREKATRRRLSGAASRSARHGRAQLHPLAAAQHGDRAHPARRPAAQGDAERPAAVDAPAHPAPAHDEPLHLRLVAPAQTRGGSRAQAQPQPLRALARRRRRARLRARGRSGTVAPTPGAASCPGGSGNGSGSSTGPVPGARARAAAARGSTTSTWNCAVRSARVRRVAPEQLELRHVLGREVPAVGVQLEDLARLPGRAGRPSARRASGCRRARRRAAARRSRGTRRSSRCRPAWSARP